MEFVDIFFLFNFLKIYIMKVIILDTSLSTISHDFQCKYLKFIILYISIIKHNNYKTTINHS